MLNILILITVLACSATGVEKVKDNWQSDFQHGLEEYMKTGEKSSELDNALIGLEYPQLFRRKLANVEERVVNTLVCEACRIGLGVVISAYRLGVPKSIAAKTVASLCVWFKIEAEEVCQGLVNSNIDIIAYIIDNRPKLDSKRVCSMLLQDYQCEDPDRVNWSIDVPLRNHVVDEIDEVPQQNGSFKILHLTDFHFDPYYTVGSNANCELPLCCQPGTKPKTPQDAAGFWGDYRYCNTPWHTVENLFDHVVNEHKDLDYVYFTGDIIRHKVWDTNVTSNTEAITKIYKKFNDTFVSTRIYPILGNHEPHPLNQFSSEDVDNHDLSTQWVFDLVADLWKSWVPPEAIKTIRRGGYYTVLVKPGFRIIALNSNVCYTFNWWLLYDDKDPFGQLQWLVDTLLDAETHHEKVHILLHVPTSESFCLENWGWEYSKIISRFSRVITAQFNGHTHEDDVTVYFDPANNKEAVNVAFNGGGVTTYNDLNPNYKVFDVDSRTLFVAHSNVQQLLASIWYEGLPGFRRKNMVLQALEIVRIGILFPFFSAAYVLAPHSVIGKTMRKPFIKFICNSASYFAFLFMLILASQRIETLFFDEQPEDVPTKRGAKPSLVEWIILAWVCGLIWSEIKQLWDVGLEEYARDMWNVIDFITNSLYVATVALRVVSYYQVQRNPKSETIKREDWDAWDPMLISEGLFSAANIFSSLKLVYIFSVNPHLGPLQVSLSRMVMDIMKFFFLYVLVLFAFSCGLNQLLWYYADAERVKCPSEVSKPVCADIILDPKPPNHTKLTNCTMSDTLADSNACTIWRRFANLFETTQTLFWAVFGLVDLESFELSGIKIFTRFWGMLMFGTYSVINIVVLLNLLIAMMNHSYQLISERADVEWKFARSKLWISYFEEGGTVPPPFNIIATPKSAWYVIEWIRRKLCGHSKAAKKEHMRTIRRKVKQASERDFRYQSIMRNLVRRYVTVEQRKAENQGVTEDDVNEIKQDISAFRFELIEILKNSGMNTSTAQSGMGSGAGGKKNRQKERRLMKGFNIGPQPSTTTAPLPPVAEFIASLQQHHQEGQQHDLFGSTLSGIFNSTPRKIHQQSTVSSSQGSINEGSYHHHHHHHHRGLTKYENWFHVKRGSAHKRRWGTLIEAAKSGKVSRLIGRSRSEDSVCNSTCRENGHNHSHSHSNSPASDENGSVSASDSNPSLDIVPPELPRQEEHHHGLTSGLLLLKKKRKKFSASRNASPIVQPHNAIEHPIPVSSGKSNKKILKRASSVPVRVSEVVPPAKRNLEQTQSEQESVDMPPAVPTLTPSTTEESVAAVGQSVLPTGTSSREPLLYNSSSSTQATGSSQTPEDEYKHNGQYYNSKLPGIIPISGHSGPTGWL